MLKAIWFLFLFWFKLSYDMLSVVALFNNVAARVHRVISRKGITWSSEQKVKILKGACPGCHSRNMYATLEYFLLEGCEGNAGGT